MLSMFDPNLLFPIRELDGADFFHANHVARSVVMHREIVGILFTDGIGLETDN